MIRNEVEIVFVVEVWLHLVQGQSISFPILFPSCLMKMKKKMFMNSILFLKNKENGKIFVNKQIVLGVFSEPCY